MGGGSGDRDDSQESSYVFVHYNRHLLTEKKRFLFWNHSFWSFQNELRSFDTDSCEKGRTEYNPQLESAHDRLSDSLSLLNLQN